MSDDLASGFRDVDGAADFAVYSRCLDLVESIPFFAECKRASYELLGAGPGRRVLDVGCGLGEDAAALAKLVAPDGAVVGVDGSRGMIEAARKRHGAVEGLSFEVADAAALPFDDASFDACRIDRVLQHIADPAPVIREMARVLRPGGSLVAYDNDWETLTVDSPDRAATRTVLNAWCDRFPSGWIGRRMVPLFLQAGLRDVVASPRTLVFRELDVADRLYCFFATVDRLAEAGTLGPEEARSWSEGLRAADREGRFFSSYTGFLVRGVRP
ncbi:methyltransferase domain-containing protein [Paludisphaera mucosa]|uniref:Methyltransferase domain-containing protein n=1 Tax=Paludisphaera mucosa TaxID=3030827 RepID=A0ABT6F475_9BACT|nr:methyltransferase domain-containing protein [Paludisphaera mucosa]MDG3002388.1 methyltransferase domain-containing protein [Paludisphaera mucosa]